MTTAIAPRQEIELNLVRMKDNFKDALPSHISPERFIATAKTALANSPSLAGLERQSLYQSFMQAAQDGLLPDGREAAIVPFAGRAKYMPMTAGICKKVRNSGEIGTIDSQVVYEKDEYEAWTDERGPHFKFVKAKGDRGAVLLTFAYALGKDGSVYFEEITEEEMQKIRAMSKAKDSPWNGPFANEMRRKSALRRLAKYRLPNSSDLTGTFDKDDEIYDAEESEETTSDTPKPSRLKGIIEAETVATPAPTEVIPPTLEEATAKVVQGKIENLSAKDGEKDGKAWRRFAVKIGGNFYGTFDTKINDAATAAVDAGQEVQIEYTERQVNGKVFRDIVSLVAVEQEGEEGIPI